MARSAVPALTARLADSELQIAHSADLALWQIDVPAAASGWQPFTSEEYRFSVLMPGPPIQEDKPVLGGVVVAHSFQGWHRAGPYQAPTRYIALVVNYPRGVLPASEEERFRAMKESAPFFTTGKVVEEKDVSQVGLRGREYLVEVEGLGRLQNRVFWVGETLYGLIVAYKPEFVNAPAAAYFLDSFRLKENGHRGHE
jgi:hypothetical protein